MKSSGKWTIFFWHLQCEWQRKHCLCKAWDTHHVLCCHLVVNNNSVGSVQAIIVFSIDWDFIHPSGKFTGITSDWSLTLLHQPFAGVFNIVFRTFFWFSSLLYLSATPQKASHISKNEHKNNKVAVWTSCKLQILTTSNVRLKLFF